MKNKLAKKLVSVAVAVVLTFSFVPMFASSVYADETGEAPDTAVSGYIGITPSLFLPVNPVPNTEVDT